MTVTETTLAAFDGIAPGTQFSGLSFKAMCVKLNSDLGFTFVDTFMRILRMYRRKHFKCVSRARSMYEKI